MILKDLPKIYNPSLFGTGLHFSVLNDGDLERVKKAVEAAGLTDYHIEAIEPGLEDAYLSIMDRYSEAGES
jgi:hypothetical protein